MTISVKVRSTRREHYRTTKEDESMTIMKDE
jgi:hypothetical protein